VTTIETLLVPPPGFRSATVARFLWQMDEKRAKLLADTRGLDRAELQWQPAPGMNSIGMLLAHIGYAEAHLVQVGLLGEAVGHAQDVVGITEEEEGLPLAPGAPPSPALDGKELPFFDELLSRARARTHRVARTLGEEDLDRKVFRRRPDGTERVFNLAWVFYHLIEHEAGHHGQINLLRHLHRERAAR
jgi:uncharacterized damage-inducible protein DinB